jgi:peptide deformylase
MTNKNKKTLDIEIFGSEILRTPSSMVKKFDKKLQKLADKMLKTMYVENGVGLAAPQVGENIRLIVIDDEWSADDDYRAPKVLVNPMIVFKEGEMESYEGCLSFPGVFFNVTRAHRIVFKYQDLSGKEYRSESEANLLTRVIQHEIDHLDGRLFIDIANDKAIAKEELEKHHLANVNSKPPIVLG